MHKPYKQFAMLIFGIIVTLGLTVSLQSVLAVWTAPSAAPVGGNVQPPIYTSSTVDQTITGGGDLIIGADLGAWNISGNSLNAANLYATSSYFGPPAQRIFSAIYTSAAANSVSINSNSLTYANSQSPTVMAINNTNAGLGDAQILFRLDAANNFSLGVDDTAANDYFKISVGNTLGTNDALTIDTSANVGIGDTDPDSLLSIRSGGPNSVQLTILQTGTGDSQIGFRQANGGPNLFTVGTDRDDNNKFKISTTALGGANDRLTIISATGNVGIGSSSPFTKLTVDGNIMLTGGLYDNTYSAGANGMVLQTTGTGFRWVATSTLGIAGTGGSLPAGTINQTLRHNGTTWAAADNLVNNGINIGIGQLSPMYRLDVAGVLRVSTTSVPAAILNSTADAQILLQSPDTWTGIGFDDSAASVAEYIWHYGNTGTFAIGGGGSNGPAGKKLHVDGGTSIGANADNTAIPANGLYVEGSVGLGDDTPDNGAKLDVAGKIAATEYCDQNGQNCTAITALGGGGGGGLGEVISPSTQCMLYICWLLIGSGLDCVPMQYTTLTMPANFLQVGPGGRLGILYYYLDNGIMGDTHPTTRWYFGSGEWSPCYSDGNPM